MFRANYTGSQLERFVECSLQSQGYQKCDDGKWLLRNYKTLTGRYYATQACVGEAFYKDKKRYVDFLVVNNEAFCDALIIECKWQESVGSVEEKFLYLVECIKKTKIPTIVLLDGDGYSLGAQSYLKSAVDGQFFLYVWEMKHFQKALTSEFFGTGVAPSSRSISPYEHVDMWRKEENAS